MASTSSRLLFDGDEVVPRHSLSPTTAELESEDGAFMAGWNAMGPHSWVTASVICCSCSLHHACRHPAALAMVGGYLQAAAQREDRIDDDAVAVDTFVSSRGCVVFQSGGSRL